MSEPELQPSKQNEVDVESSPPASIACVDPTQLPEQTEGVRPPSQRSIQIFKSKPDQTPWWKIALEVAALFAVICYTIAAFKQLGVMNGQLVQMRDATEAAQQAAYAACLGAQVSRSALLETQHAEADAHGSAVAAVYQAMAATESERAEMQLKLGKAVLEVGNDFHIPFNVVNAGKTAAIGLVLDFRLVFLPRNADPDFRYPKGEVGHGFNRRQEPGPMFQVGEHQIVALGPNEQNLIPTEADARDYAAGTKDMVLYGRMTYHDIFGGSHWRNFCEALQTLPNGLIRDMGHQKCADYNGSDVGNIGLNRSTLAQNPISLPDITCKKPN